MKHSESTLAIDAMIAAIQKAIEPISKNKEVKIEGDKAQWKSRYATLQTLDDAVRARLTGAGLHLLQGCEFMGPGGWALVSRLTYEAEWYEVTYPIKASREGGQGFGGGLAFARRWALCGLFNLVPNDLEEGQGYKDAAAEGKPPRRAAAPAGIASAIEAVRSAVDSPAFVSAVAKARGAHPTGDASAAIERAVESWFVDAFSREDLTVPEFETLRATANTVKPRGSAVREAIAKTAREMVPR